MFDGTFHFASELPALARSPLWRGDVDLSALEGYLSLGYFIAPATIYRDVQKLLPGHWLRVANGRIEIREYWDVREFDTEQRPDEELIRRDRRHDCGRPCTSGSRAKCRSARS